ncbi:YheT family hydrolase [Coraliomargarita parva]|uniref:YheT family hydrolase n=1 Tax=Coraliomargarita parva TaxID=3014050 RepID=UPI0022B4CBF9|nr:alpha/beta fold hydrolase [Coraliomargarita parva]
MPLLQSSYRPPFGFWSGHLQTIYPALFRKVRAITTQRERIETPDEDFIDLDWYREGSSKRLAILTHGLEGNSQRAYVQGAASVLKDADWHVLAWNLPSCSGEPNRRLSSYHSGSTDHLETVLKHVFALNQYDRIALVGYSLGGNIQLKYLGDLGRHVDARIQATVAFSVATDLEGGARQLEHWSNRIYMQRFLKTLRAKVLHKMDVLPGELSDEGLHLMRTFREFDNAYTAPIHGFHSAQDYWRQCSCGPRLSNIRVPTLLVNAKDDPFLSPSCYPVEAAQRNRYLYLEIPKNGGHMGFIAFNQDHSYWSDRRMLEFLTEHLSS